MAKRTGRGEEQGKKKLEGPGGYRSRIEMILLAGAVLVVLTLTAYWGLGSASFITIDDGGCVTDNPHVKKGVSWDNLKWAFSNNLLGNYIPLTQLSHMLDVEIWGMNAGGHHVTSLLIHILNSLLLLVLLERMTGAVWRSAAVAALFAVHPLHVESVAWIAERKDVLSAFFWFMGLLAYAFYAEKRSIARFLPVFFAFLLGLLSKAMIITFPFLLLLLDYWPLERWPSEGRGACGDSGKRNDSKRPALWNLVLEKWPLFALVPVFMVITVSAQKTVGATSSLVALPLGQRIANALVSYAGYLKKMFLPVDLAAYYPFRQGTVSVPPAVLCGILFAALTFAALWFGRKRRYLATGWLWYVGTLLPVIGLVQVGGQAMADRYTYVPLVGVFMMAVWGTAEIAAGTPFKRKVAAAGWVAVILTLAVLTRTQTGYWKDSFSVAGRALAVTTDNWFMRFHMGSALEEQGRKEEALSQYEEAVRISPSYSDAHLNLGNLLQEKGRYPEAVVHYETALKNSPYPARVLYNMGMALRKMNRLPDAIGKLEEAVRADPGLVEARTALGNALSDAGRYDEAIEQYGIYLKFDPGSALTLNNIGLAYAKSGRFREAADKFGEAAGIAPGFFDAHLNLGVALGRLERHGEARDAFRKALQIDPGSKVAEVYLRQAENAAAGAKER